MAKTCPYHNRLQPCRDCLIQRRGEFAFYKPKPGMCPYHGNANPCLTCFDNKQGEFAHVGTVVSKTPYVPPARRNMAENEIVHFHQTKKDTCAVACCAMVGAFLNCPREFSYEELEECMVEQGVYLPGDKSLFHALDKPLEWLGLKCAMKLITSAADLPETLQPKCVVILEALGHVLVVFGANPDGSLIIGDPAMHKVEYDVASVDYRLKGSRIWVVSLTS